MTELPSEIKPSESLPPKLPFHELLHRFLVTLWFDIRQYSHDLILFAMGRHRLAYRDREGGLPSPVTYKRAVIVAIWPDKNSLPFTLNLLRGLSENGFFV